MCPFFKHDNPSFSFEALSVEEVSRLPDAELRAFLLSVYGDFDLVHGQLSKASKSGDVAPIDAFNRTANLLGYLYSLCAGEKLANTLINSSLTCKCKLSPVKLSQ